LTNQQKKEGIKMKDAVKLLTLMLTAIKAVQAVKRAAGEEGFKFFLNIFGLQQKETVNRPITIRAATQPVEQVATPPAPALAPVTQPVVSGVKPGTILSAPMLRKSLPSSRPERTMRGTAPVQKPQLATAPASVSYFAAQLNNAAVQLGHEDKSPLGQFRKTLGMIDSGRDYWDRCRKILTTVLSEGLIKEESDWKLLTEKMKHNLFFNGRDGEMFLKMCPKEILIDLITDQDGFPKFLGLIQNEENNNPNSPRRLSFMIEVCKAGGEEAKVVLERCKNAVIFLKRNGVLKSNHPLVQKVAVMNHPRIPEIKWADLGRQQEPIKEEVQANTLPATDQPVVPAEAAMEPAAITTDEELEKLTAPGKPVKVDLGAAYEQQMLSAAGESITVQ
jgi:hypothetical protein